MTPQQEQIKRLAESVMGWEMGKDFIVSCGNQICLSGKFNSTFWNPFTSDGDAVMVLRALKEKGVIVTSWKSEWGYTYKNLEGCGPSATHKSDCAAICNFALAWLDAQEKGGWR